MATKVQQTEVRFLSENRGLRMQRRTQGEMLVGNNIKDNPAEREVTYAFEKGVLTLRRGQDVMADGIDPDTGEIVEQDAIEWIRSTPEYNTRIIEVEPVAPDPGPLYVEVGRLTAEKDVEGLIALGDEENDSWARDEVLDAIRTAVEGLSATPEKAKA